MASVMDAIGNAQALAENAVSKAVGTTITLSHRGAGAVTLNCEIIDSAYSNSMTDVNHGRKAETGKIVFLIPVQTSFAVMTDNVRPVTVGDRIVWPVGSNRTWTVTDEISQQGNGYLFYVPAIETKTMHVGTVS